ncbi:MAG TPA: hypothetical protein VHM02_14345, partial [Thermoanaerobaculia bacterium]|nr:hypothetical protein [Thermoanaerobaculia bacterium]
SAVPGVAAALALALLAVPAAAQAPPPHPLEAVPFFAGKEVVSLSASPGAPHRLYAVADRTLHLSIDGGASWEVLATPPSIEEGPSFVESVAAHPWLDEVVLAGVLTHLVRSDDGGATWQDLSSRCARPLVYAFGISEPQRFYVAGPGQSSLCFRSPDPNACAIVRGDGAAPTTCISERPAPMLATALAVDPRDADRVLAASGGSVFRSEDGGATWTELTDALQSSVLRLSPGDPDVVFAGTFEQGLWRSDDFGESWRRIDGGGFTDRVDDLEIDPVDPTTLHAIVDGGKGWWTSRDGGESWEAQWHGVPPAFFNDVELAPGDPSVVYLATDDGLYRRELVDGRLCVPGPRTLCLLDGRVRVEVAWRAFDGSSGLGNAVPATGESGWFWFFDPANPELVVKALDGRPVNGELWLFYGSLSNVEMILTATDTVGGEAVSFFNPPGRFASAGHTAPFARALPLSAGAAEAAAEAAWSPPLVAPQGIASATSPTAAGTAACAAPGGLCLHGRFRLTVEWEDFFGNRGPGQPLPLTSDAGFFWFFEPGNLELVVKVLDARVLNGHWWVFYGALSNVAYRLRVEDTATGEVRTYDNPLHHFGSRGDTAAFPGG